MPTTFQKKLNIIVIVSDIILFVNSVEDLVLLLWNIISKG